MPKSELCQLMLYKKTVSYDVQVGVLLKIELKSLMSWPINPGVLDISKSCSETGFVLAFRHATASYEPPRSRTPFVCG